MKTLFTLFVFLLGVGVPGFGQKLLVSAGYTRVGEKSFTGAASVGLHTIISLGKYGAAGAAWTAARNYQPYKEFIPGFLGVGGRTITGYHNFLYSLHGFLAGRLALGSHLEATLGPSAGLYLVGSRERSAELRPGFGLWSNLTYKQLRDSRFNLEASFHPRRLLSNAPVEDGDFRFDGRRLWLWDAQIGISYELRKLP